MISASFSAIVAGQPEFSVIIPSPPSTILESAVYRCSVTGVGQSDNVVIRWRVNDTSSLSPSEWQQFISVTGITLTGTSTDSTLTIPGDTTLNETTVVSIASGSFNESVYFASESHTLYIQGIYNDIYNS